MRAGEGNRTPISGLGSQRLNHWTTPAGWRAVYRPLNTLQDVRPRVYWPVMLAAAALVALLTYGVASTGPDTSIDERSIINSLAASRSFSAVEFFPPGSLVGTLVFNCGP